MDRVRFTTYQHAKDENPSRYEGSMEDVFELLSTHDEIDCSPCKGHDCPKKKQSMAISPCWPRSGCVRQDKFVESLDFLVFDFDHLSAAGVEEVASRFDEIDCLMYSSHSHAPPDNCAVRVVCSISRRVTKVEWRAFWAATSRRYAPNCDPKCKNESRIYFMPNCSKGAERINVRSGGKPVDVDALMLEQAKYTAQTRAVVPSAPQAEPGEVNLKKLRDRLRRYDPPGDLTGEWRERMRRVLAGEPLADKPGRDGVKFEGPAIYGRDDTVVAVAFTIGKKLFNAPVEAAMEILRPSIASMPRYEDDGPEETVEAWIAKAEKHFRAGAQAKFEELSKPAQAYAKLFGSMPTKWFSIGLDAEEEESPLAATVPSAPAGSSSPPAAPPGSPPPPKEDEEEWRKGLKHVPTKSGEVFNAPVGMNAAHILEHHPDWRGVLRFNEVTKEIDCFGGPLLRKHRKPEQLLTAVENWLQRFEDLNLHTHVVKAQLLHVSRGQSYDPLKDFLNALGAKWDGTERIETFLEEYCGARIDDDAGRDLTEYVRMVSKRWFIACVARGLDPGCKMDNVLVLEGAQSLGKSTMVELLGGEFHSDNHIKFEDKDSKMLAAKSWIIEMPDLACFHGTETNTQKAFFTRRVDDFRAPYAPLLEKCPRRCVFVGTVNPEEDAGYMFDLTGNRRYWPVYLTFIDADAIRRDREQLFAEAVTYYRQLMSVPEEERAAHDHRFWFSKAESEKWDFVTTQRLQTGDVSDAVSDWWREMEPAKRPTDFRGYDVAIEALRMTPGQVNQKVLNNIGRSLKKWGFERFQKREGLSRVWVYRSTEELRSLPKIESRLKRKLAVITGGKDDSKKEQA